MEYTATEYWDEALWSRAEEIYRESFPEHGRKNRAIVRRMFERRICALHVLEESGEAAAMALTAFDDHSNTLIVDYLAVRRSRRGRGVGREMLRRIREWAIGEKPECLGMVIEVEADPSEENEARIRFWERIGFRLTDYVKSYIWVPETYRAMTLGFDEDKPLTNDGRELFKAIVRYHEKAYRSGSKPVR